MLFEIYFPFWRVLISLKVCRVNLETIKYSFVVSLLNLIIQGLQRGKSGLGKRLFTAFNTVPTHILLKVVKSNDKIQISQSKLKIPYTVAYRLIFINVNQQFIIVSWLFQREIRCGKIQTCGRKEKIHIKPLFPPLAIGHGFLLNRLLAFRWVSTAVKNLEENFLFTKW